jgi:hypothetical protein
MESTLRKKIILTLLGPFALGGCASQYVYRATQSAELVIAGNSKQFYVETHKDEACAPSEYGLRLATFYGPTANVTDHEKGIVVAVPTDRRFLMTFRYIDAQFALNRICNMMVGFTPSQGAKYRAYFSVLPDVTGCGASITEIAESGEREVPSFFLAPNVCSNGRDRGPINGRPQRLQWGIQIIR